MGRDSDVCVWGAAGGQGSTTVATVLAAESKRSMVGSDPWVPSWILGEELPELAAGSVVDTGSLISNSRRPEGVNLVVLRGPCLVALRRVQPLVAADDQLVVIREPWRTISNDGAADALGVEVAFEVPFSERIARLSDAGLLGARLSKLSEFDGLRRWVGESMPISVDRSQVVGSPNIRGE